MPTLDDVQTWRGVTMVDADGDKVGSVEDIYLDRQTGEPEWVTVRTGLFGTKVSFVPIHDAERTEDGKIRVPFEKKPVKDAPRTEPDGELSPEEEQRLYEHFGRSDYGDWQGDDRTTSLGLPDEGERRFERPVEGGQAGVDADRSDADIGAPPVVGVRLRRIIVVAAAPVDDEQRAPRP